MFGKNLEAEFTDNLPTYRLEYAVCLSRRTVRPPP